jgi:GH24 family phage-related lysozyme (muramidase)
VSPTTRKEADVPDAAVLRLGARGEKVKTLQVALTKAGFRVASDGVFGPATDQAVRKAQAAHGLVVDGIAGPRTFQALKPRAQASQAADGNGLTERGAAFIGHFEGFSAKLYNDPAGHCTIGFGHLVHHGAINGSEPAAFKRGITRARALELLRADAKAAADAVNGNVKRPLKPHQRDALIDFTFNVGAGAFASSTLLKRLNQGEYAAVPAELNRWTLAGGKRLPGLVRRRQAEGELFSAGRYVT